MKHMIMNLFCISLISVTAFSAENDQDPILQSTPEEFREFSEAMQGRWISEIIWINDWPGFGERGDTVTGYAEWQIGLDGKVVNGREYIGPGSGRSILYYDEYRKQITDHVVTSGGNVFVHYIYKDNGEWNYKITGSTGDGKEITGSAIRYISDQGQTHRWIGEMFIDGEELDPLRDTYRRIGD